jgi:hypothetical protein
VALVAATGCGLILIVAEHVSHQSQHRSTKGRRPASATDHGAAGVLATRRAEHDGRSPKRRPVGRGAAEGGGAHRLLGNSQFPLRADETRGVGR